MVWSEVFGAQLKHWTLASILHEGRRFGPEDPNPTSCHDIASA